MGLTATRCAQWTRVARSTSKRAPSWSTATDEMRSRGAFPRGWRGSTVAILIVSAALIAGCGEARPDRFDIAPPDGSCEAATGSDACVGAAPATLHDLPFGLGILTGTAGVALVTWGADRSAATFTAGTGYGSVNPDDTLVGCELAGSSASVFLGSRQTATMSRLWDLDDEGQWDGGPDFSAPAMAPRCADIDGDGLDDLVGLWTPESRLRVYRGSDRFDSRWEVPADLDDAAGPRFASVLSDVDGDGESEYIFSSLSDPRIHIFTDLRNGETISASSWAPGAANLGALHVREGSLRVIWVGVDAEGVAGVLGAVDVDPVMFEPTFDQNFETLHAANRLYVSDFNQDGSDDALVAAMPGDRYALHLGQSDGSFAEAIIVEVPVPLIDLAAKDLDSDGHADLASVVAGTDLLQVSWGDGTGAFAVDGR